MPIDPTIPVPINPEARAAQHRRDVDRRLDELSRRALVSPVIRPLTPWFDDGPEQLISAAVGHGFTNLHSTSGGTSRIVLPTSDIPTQWEVHVAVTMIRNSPTGAIRRRAGIQVWHNGVAQYIREGRRSENATYEWDTVDRTTLIDVPPNVVVDLVPGVYGWPGYTFYVTRERAVSEFFARQA